MSPTLGIVFCFRDRDLDRVQRGLDSLQKQSDGSFRVIYVDYGSRPEVSTQLESLCKKYPFCDYRFVNSRGKNWNRADALNCGMALTQTPWYFTADADLIFLPGFIQHVAGHTKKRDTVFFAVGYLDGKNTHALSSKSPEELPYSRSEGFAQGMMLMSRDTAFSINGYNRYYSLWGGEDNDIHGRLLAAKLPVATEQEVWLLHQYHEPAQNSLPDGWIQLMKDYAAGSTKQPHPFKGLNETNPKDIRSVTPYLSPAYSSKEIKARSWFISQVILHDLLSTGGNNWLKYRISLEEPPASRAFRIARRMNSILRALQLPLVVKNEHSLQYASRADVYSQLLLTLKVAEPVIEDYFLAERPGYFELTVVKVQHGT
jgi:hypothetical protein